MTQRWRAGRDSYRPAGEVIDTSKYEVAEITDDTPAKAFVVEHHYSGGYPAARFRFGLYRAGDLVGVAVFSHPANDKVLTSVFPVAAADATELGRFVLLDDVPANGETWMLGRCFEQLRDRVAGVVSFSDPVARTDSGGARVFPGHLGIIYRAHNGRYVGRGTARTLRLLPDGKVFSARAMQKIRAREQGWRYAAAILERHGASALAEDADPRLWLRTWLPRITRPLKHGGNLKYVWPIDRALRAHLPPALPYPTREELAC